MESYELKQVEAQYNMAVQAWFNAEVQAVDNDGKPVFKKFDDFYNYLEEVNKVKAKYEPDYVPIKKKKSQSKMDIMIRRIKEFKKKHPRKGGGK